MIADDVVLGLAVKVYRPELVNLYGCSIGSETTIGPFVEIQQGVSVGERCKISSHSFLCTGVTVGHGVFIRATTRIGPEAASANVKVSSPRRSTLASIASSARPSVDPVTRYGAPARNPANVYVR